MGYFGRNGHLWQACSLSRMHIDSCPACSGTPGCTAAARCTRPRLEPGGAKMRDRTCKDTPVVYVLTCACAVTCLAAVAPPAQRTGAKVGPYAGASVHTWVYTHSCETVVRFRRHSCSLIRKTSDWSSLVGYLGCSGGSEVWSSRGNTLGRNVKKVPLCSPAGI